MAITGSITKVSSDFADNWDKLIAVNCPNVLEFAAVISDPSPNAYVECEISRSGFFSYTFKMINKDFTTTTGNFYFDFTEILPYMFPDISDDTLTSGVQSVVDTGMFDLDFECTLYPDVGEASLDTYGGTMNLLFSSKQVGNSNGSNESDWYAHQSPNFIAQKNKQSYIYHYGKGTISFEKINRLPIEQTLIDFEVPLMDDGELLINTI